MFQKVSRSRVVRAKRFQHFGLETGNPIGGIILISGSGVTDSKIVNPQFHRYDSRLGQDYSIVNYYSKRTFSSLEHGFLVLDFVGPMDWKSRASLLQRCLEATSKRLFFMVDPWEPTAGQLGKALVREFSTIGEFEQSLCGYTTINIATIVRLFDLRTEFGGDNSGQWCIGGCLADFAPPVRLSMTRGQLWDSALVLDQAEKVGCMLSLGEMQQSLFITRHFDGLDNLLLESLV